MNTPALAHEQRLGRYVFLELSVVVLAIRLRGMCAWHVSMYTLTPSKRQNTHILFEYTLLLKQ